MISLFLAWRPILDPIVLPGGTWWLTIIPFALGIAMSYKAVRIPEQPGWWLRHARATIIMSVQIIALISILAIILHLIVEVFAPGISSLLNN